MQIGGAPLRPPRYLYLNLPVHVMRNVSRFCLHAQTLAVESSIWRGQNGHCDKCSCATVQNEVHVLLHRQDLFVCSLRKNYSFLFFPFCPFLWRPLIFCIPCLVTVFGFLSQRHNKLSFHLGYYGLFFGLQSPATNQSA